MPPKSAAERGILATALRGSPFLGEAALGEGALADMIDAMEPRAVSSGEALMQQGEPGDRFYIIEAGKVGCRKPHASAGSRRPLTCGACPSRLRSHSLPHPPRLQFDIVTDGVIVAEWGEGTANGTVGELALLHGGPRAATVRATTPGRVWSIDRATFRSVLEQDGRASRERIRAAVWACFRPYLSEEQMARLVDAAHLVSFRRGAHIAATGTAAAVWYVVESGLVSRTYGADAAPPPSSQPSVAALMAGDFTATAAQVRGGLGGLLHESDLRADTDAALVALAREDFEPVLNELVVMFDDMAAQQILWSVPALQQLNEVERARLLAKVTERRFEPGETILRAGGPVEHFYVIREGEVLVQSATAASAAADGVRSSEGSPGAGGGEGTGGAVVGVGVGGLRLLRGQSFGEEAEVEGVPLPCLHTYTAARGGGAARCFLIDSETFRLTVGSARARAGGQADGSAGGQSAPRNERRFPGFPFGEFELLRTISTGTTSRVRLARQRTSGRVFALKGVRRLGNERDILMRFYHPFIVQLYETYEVRRRGRGAVVCVWCVEGVAPPIPHPSSFVPSFPSAPQERDCFFMLMELVQGGDLFSRLQNSATPGRVSLDEVRFYAGCVVAAFEHLHAISVVYRDLKPESLLIDADGYLKLVDFGFAKIVHDRTYTLCGTPEYLAPELVLSRGHNKGVDYWALGALLYEMAAGYNPFTGANDDLMVICRNILRGEVKFPAHVVDEHVSGLWGDVAGKG
jgi:CRP-like cAMP-binding protein